MVIKSNELDNRVLLDISKIMLENFKNTTGYILKVYSLTEVWHVVIY